MPNKGKKSIPKQTKQGKKARTKSTSEISRSFAKKDSNIAVQTSNENQITDRVSSESIKVSNSKAALINSATASLYPNLNRELIRIFATTGVIICILIGLSFII
jgi:hypothetical protein